MEIDAEAYELLLGTDEYEVVWQGKPTREMKLRGWTDALFDRLLGPSLHFCSSNPDQPLCSKLAMWAGENSVDLTAHQDVVAKRRKKRERARLKLIKANGYQRSALSEISARFRLIKKEIPKIMKHAESFMRVYSTLLPNASYWLTGMFAGSGFYDRDSDWKSIGPGQRKFCEPRLSISTRFGDGGIVRVKITSQGVYLPYMRPVPHRPGCSRLVYRKAQIEKPGAVIDAFQKMGMILNAHDMAAIFADFQKHSGKRKTKN